MRETRLSTFYGRLPKGTRTPTAEEAVTSMLEAAGDNTALRDAVIAAAVAVYGQDVVDRVFERTCFCGEPEDGGEFGWFTQESGETVCNACGSVVPV